MTESQIEDHMEEWRRQEIDDREFLERQDLLASVDCMECIYRTESGMCANITSIYFGEDVSYDVCDEWEGYDD